MPGSFEEAVQKMRAELRDEALRWANQIRSDQGREPLADLPRGVRGSSTEDPLARATGLMVDGDHFYSRCEVEGDDISPEGELPEDVRLFALDFDAGFHPELVEATA